MIIYLIIALIVLILDQVTKWLVKTNMALHETIPVLGDFFVLTSHRNKGAAFGILQGQQTFFLIVTVIFLVGISWYLYKSVKSGQRLVPFALSLMLGGAVGNFYDRAMHGEVVDFLQFTFQGSIMGWKFDYIFPIFNAADSGIVIGTILILFDSLRSWRLEAKQEAAKAEEPTHEPV